MKNVVKMLVLSLVTGAFLMGNIANAEIAEKANVEQNVADARNDLNLNESSANNWWGWGGYGGWGLGWGYGLGYGLGWGGYGLGCGYYSLGCGGFGGWGGWGYGWY